MAQAKLLIHYIKLIENDRHDYLQNSQFKVVDIRCSSTLAAYSGSLFSGTDELTWTKTENVVGKAINHVCAYSTHADMRTFCPAPEY